MGCSNSKGTSEPKTKKNKKGKPKKDYSLDPKFQAFCAMDAEGDITNPKSMHLNTLT